MIQRRNSKGRPDGSWSKDARGAGDSDPGGEYHYQPKTRDSRVRAPQRESREEEPRIENLRGHRRKSNTAAGPIPDSPSLRQEIDSTFHSNIVPETACSFLRRRGSVCSAVVLADILSRLGRGMAASSLKARDTLGQRMPVLDMAYIFARCR